MKIYAQRGFISTAALIALGVLALGTGGALVYRNYSAADNDIVAAAAPMEQSAHMRQQRAQVGDVQRAMTPQQARHMNDRSAERELTEARMTQEIAQHSTGTISAQEQEDLLYMREEEKLARDVYRTLYDKWGMQVFANIARSEEQHTLAVKALLARYNLTDPVVDDAVGVFQNADLRALYEKLVADGSASAAAALRVGATIEDLDIRDLRVALARTDNADIAAVYENLMRGSRNHMRAFYRQLQQAGETYVAQYISADELAHIVGSGIERGDHDGSAAERGKRATNGMRGKGAAVDVHDNAARDHGRQGRGRGGHGMMGSAERRGGM